MKATLQTGAAVAGVELIGPVEPQFLPLLEVLRGGRAEEALVPALACSVIALNRAERTVGLLGVRFDMEGRQRKPYSVVHYADTLRYPESADLTPGGMRFICAEPIYTDFVLRRQSVVDPRGPMNIQNLQNAGKIAASIDCVAFIDGKFHGPDSLGAFERLARERAAEGELIVAVLANDNPETVLGKAVSGTTARGLARQLYDGLLNGGPELVTALARQHRRRIELRRA